MSMSLFRSVPATRRTARPPTCPGRHQLRCAQIQPQRVVPTPRIRLFARQELAHGPSAAASARSFYNTYINLNQNASPPYFATTLDVGPTTPVTNFLANGGLTPTAGATTGALTPAAARAAVASYTFDQTRPYALNGTLGVQRLLAKTTLSKPAMSTPKACTSGTRPA